MRIALAGTIATGTLVLGAGTAFAHEGGHGDDDHQKKSSGCDYRVEKDAPLKETDFPSDNHFGAYANTTPKDALDGHGKPYFLHNKVCQTHKPWRSTKYWEDEYGDKSYDTFKFGRDKNGQPSRDPKKNTYIDYDGYDDEIKKDKKKDLEPDHIGVPKDPKYLNH